MTIDFFTMLQGSNAYGQWLVYIGFLLAAIGAVVAATGLLIALKTSPQPSEVGLVPQTTNIYNVYYGNMPTQAEPTLPHAADFLKTILKSAPERNIPEPEPPGVNR